MSKNEAGSFRKKDTGRWEYRFYYRDEYNLLHYKSVTGTTKEMCLSMAEEFLQRQQMFSRGIAIDMTIPDILKDRYRLDFEKGYIKEQGYGRNLATIVTIENHPLGKIPIIDIEKGHIDAFLRFITKYSNTTIKKIYSMLSCAFLMALEQGIIDKNPLKDRSLRCPRSVKRDKIVRGLTEEEQKRLVTTLAEYNVPYGRNNYKAQILIELYAGLRMGEINALKPSDIKFTKDGGFIHVERTVSRGIDCRPFISDSTKTDAGIRDVPISKPLVPVLEKAIKNMGKNPQGLLFYDYIKGGIIETTQVNCFYRRLCEKANVPFYGQHALRHTFATRCIESGIPAIVLKSWLGHRDIHVTLDTYSDVFSRMNHKSLDLFNSYIDELNNG